MRVCTTLITQSFVRPLRGKRWCGGGGRETGVVCTTSFTGFPSSSLSNLDICVSSCNVDVRLSVELGWPQPPGSIDMIRKEPSSRSSSTFAYYSSTIFLLVYYRYSTDTIPKIGSLIEEAMLRVTSPIVPTIICI